MQDLTAISVVGSFVVGMILGVGIGISIATEDDSEGTKGDSDDDR